MTFESNKFVSWINEKYDEFRKGNPRIKVTHYAKHVEVSSQVMSNWLLGKVKEAPAGENLEKLYLLYGEEIYDILELPKPDPVRYLPPGMQPLIREWLTETENAGAEPGDDRSIYILKELAARYEKNYIDMTENKDALEG